MLTTKEQKKCLFDLMKAASNEGMPNCNYGVLLYVERPGDVSSLVPVFPELRGYDIVCATGAYDVWFNGIMTSDCDLTIDQMCQWLMKYQRSDEDVMANVALWTQDVLSRLAAGTSA